MGLLTGGSIASQAVDCVLMSVGECVDWMIVWTVQLESAVAHQAMSKAVMGMCHQKCNALDGHHILLLRGAVIHASLLLSDTLKVHVDHLICVCIPPVICCVCVHG